MRGRYWACSGRLGEPELQTLTLTCPLLDLRTQDQMLSWTGWEWKLSGQKWGKAQWTR